MFEFKYTLNEDEAREIVVESLKDCSFSEVYLDGKEDKKRRKKARWLLKNWYMSSVEWDDFKQLTKGF